MKIFTLVWFLFSILLSVNGNAQCGTVTDYDGNVYNTVVIGTQCWMQENLKASHYNNGTAITEIQDSLTWATIFNTNDSIPAWCYYNNDTANNSIYGKLYNWYVTINTNQVCPTGWHVPDKYEVQQLSDYLGGDSVSGGHLKSTDNLWLAPNAGADNSSGFTELPSGIRNGAGHYNSMHKFGYFWTTTSYDSANFAVRRNMNYGNIYSHGNPDNMNNAFPIRCLSNSGATGISPVTTPESLIFVNQTGNQLTINASGIPVEVVRIYSTCGQLLMEIAQPGSGIDINQLSTGVYIAEIKTKQANVMRKWVKM